MSTHAQLPALANDRTTEIAATQAELARLRQEAEALRERIAAGNAGINAPKAPRSSEQPFTGPYMEASQVDQQPRPVSQSRPIYPPELRRLGIEGKATLSFIVDAEGNVRNAVCTSVTHTAFAASALEAVTRWQFAAALKDGRPVATRFELPMIFQMEASAKKADSSPPKTLKSGTLVPWF